MKENKRTKLDRNKPKNKQGRQEEKTIIARHKIQTVKYNQTGRKRTNKQYKAGRKKNQAEKNKQRNEARQEIKQTKLGRKKTIQKT